MSGKRIAVRETLATIRARLGLILVGLLMPLKFCFSLEDLTAVTHKVFLLRFLVQVNSGAMVEHVGVPTEALITMRAFNWHGTGVDPLVLHQTLPLHESLRTEATCVNANVEMVLEMKGKGIPTVECLLTKRTLSWVDLEVLVKEF